MNARIPIPTGLPLWMLSAETALFRVESEAQIKTAPGARCVNNEQCSQGLADWIGVD